MTGGGGPRRRVRRRTRRRLLLGLIVVAVAGLVGLAPVPEAGAAGVPRYVVSITQLKAVEEQNEHDWFTDEDVYGGFVVTSSDTKRQLSAFRTQLLKGFDEGETKTLSADKRCAPAGEIIDFKSGRSFLDARSGDRWLCRTINTGGAGLEPPFTVAGTLYSSVSCYELFENCGKHRNDPRGPYLALDIWLGNARLDFSAGGLYVDLPRVGMQRAYTMDHRANNGHYRTSVTVERVA